MKLNLKELRRIEKELKLNFRCDHLNVAPLIGMIRTEGALCAVMPLASHNLDEHFDRENDWSAKFRLAMDVCNGVHYLHINAAIVHNDIKPDNVLIFLEREVYVAKVSDLGSGFSAASATQASDGRRAAALGSVGYSAPEVGKSSANLEQSPTETCLLRDPQSNAPTLVRKPLLVAFQRGIWRSIRWNYRCRSRRVNLQFYHRTQNHILIYFRTAD